MIYKDLRDIVKVVDSFEDASIARGTWGHAEHMIVALHYLSNHDKVTATTKMRDGIMNLLVKGFNVDLSKEMPYHETITIFWMRTVEEFMRSKNGASTVEIANEMVAKFGKDHPLKFYSRELLFSDEARAGFVDADL